jgi:hypothetical protein
VTGDSLDSGPRQRGDQRHDSEFTLRWTFERADLEDVFRAFFRPRIRLLMVTPIALVCGVMFALRPALSNVAFVGAVLVALAGVLLIATIPRWMALQGWRAHPRLQGGAMEATVSAAGVQIRSPGAANDCAWDVFQRVHETDRAFLLPLSKELTSSVILPKRAMANEATDIAALRAMFHRMIDGDSSTDGPRREAPLGS